MKQKGFYIIDDIKKGFDNFVSGCKDFKKKVDDGAKEIDEKFFSKGN